jgi:nucleoside phosphorylase
VARTLILSAWEPEIAPLRRLVRGVRAVAVGVGAVDAAVGAARAIAAHRPDRVIFVGTAGAYARGRGTIAIGDAAVTAELVSVSTAALRGDGYLPAPQVVRATPTAALRAALRARGDGEVAEAVVACPAAITRTAALGRRIVTATGAALENLEAFAVARAAAAAGVAHAAVLGVSNRVGPDGHHEWRTHHVAASRAACEVVARLLREPPHRR